MTITKLPEKIGLLDSGIGGLSVLNALLPYLPKEVIYVADAAHLPYGQKTPEFLLKRGIAISRFFEEKSIFTIFVACHTLSATVVSDLKKIFPHITYVDLLPLTVHKALGVTKNNRLGVMATAATINSHSHQKLVETISSGKTTTLIEQPCPDFVVLIEKKATSQEYEASIDRYLAPLINASVDTIILGCTHYPFIQKLLEEKAPLVRFISAANSLPVFEKAATQTTINFVTTATIEYIKNGVAAYVSKDHQCKMLFTSALIPSL